MQVIERLIRVAGILCCTSSLLFAVTLRWYVFFFSSRRRHTRSVSAFLLNRSSDLGLGIPAEPLFRSKWLNMLGTFVKDWFRYESHFVHGRDSLVDILKERGLLSESDAVQPLIGKKS